MFREVYCLVKQCISLYVDHKTARLFEKQRGAFVKSRLVEYWIEQFLAGNPAYIPNYEIIKNGLEAIDSSKTRTSRPSSHNKGDDF